MYLTRMIFLLVFSAFIRLGMPAQAVFEYPDPLADKGYVTLPFKLVNRLILIPVQINGSDTLQFIFDTGLENSIICELEPDEVIELKQAREVRISGIRSGDTIDAIQSTGNHLRIGDLDIGDQDYIILSRNVLQLSRKMGTKIHGLLNLQAFRDFITEIDYERQLMTLYQPGYFREHKSLEGYTSLRMDLTGGVPSIAATVLAEKDISFPVRLILDTGAGHALSLNAGLLPGFSIPSTSQPAYLGWDFNGPISGRVARITGLELGTYHLPEVPVSYPDRQASLHEGKVNGPNGRLGAELLRRFKLMLDFPSNSIHLLANKAFEDGFYLDMSGLEIQVPVAGEHRYIVSGVLSGSRAASAGILIGDEVFSINGAPCDELSLDEVFERLLGKAGDRIRLVLVRKGKKFRTEFHRIK